MKKIMSLIVLIILASCGKDKPVASEPALPVYTEPKTTVITTVVVKEEPGVKEVSFHSTSLNVDIIGTFSIYRNEGNPNGWVIIHSFGAGVSAWKVDDYQSPEKYIYSIHGNLSLNCGKSTLQSDPKALDIFRSVEAAVIAYYEHDTTPPMMRLNESEVYQAGKTMTGRVYGIPSTKYLK